VEALACGTPVIAFNRDKRLAAPAHTNRNK
jgi:hypothetical protein